jgi:hypothetical protein
MNKILLLKVTGIVFSVGGMIISAIAGDMDTKVQLAKLVSQNTK